MSDNETMIIVPLNRVQSGPFSPLYHEVELWLSTNVSGSYSRFSTDPIDGVEQICFILYNVSNNVRMNFAKSFGGKLTFKREELFKKEKNGDFIVYIQGENVTKGRGNTLTIEVREWLEENVENKSGKWAWCTAITQDDIKYVSFIFRGLSEDDVFLFKMMFG